MKSDRSIALVGLSGTGKSTVGRILAGRLGWPLLDTDALVAQAAGCSLDQIFAEQGEAHFRDLEAATLQTVLGDTACVVATGAGIVLRAENRALLRERAHVVWLDAPTEALVARLHAHAEVRPLLQGADLAARLEKLRAARAGLYAEVAALRLETPERALELICEQIIRSTLCVRNR